MRVEAGSKDMQLDVEKRNKVDLELRVELLCRKIVQEQGLQLRELTEATNNSETCVDYMIAEIGRNCGL